MKGINNVNHLKKDKENRSYFTSNTMVLWGYIYSKLAIFIYVNI